MAIVFLRAPTEFGPRTIVFVATSDAAALLSETAAFDEISILPDRPAYTSVAQIVAQREMELDKEIARIKRRDARRANKRPDLFNNVTRLYPAKGKQDDTRPKVTKRQ